MSRDTPGVGSTPPSSAWPPAAATPAASAVSSIWPDSRVSRTIRTWGTEARETLAAARPRPSASSAVRNSPATPRTPSVPNRRRVRCGVSASRSPLARALSTSGPLTLRELRPLARLLQARLLALLGACVARQEAAPLQVGPELRVDLDEGAGDAVPKGIRLGGH